MWMEYIYFSLYYPRQQGEPVNCTRIMIYENYMLMDGLMIPSMSNQFNVL